MKLDLASLKWHGVMVSKHAWCKRLLSENKILKKVVNILIPILKANHTKKLYAESTLCIFYASFIYLYRV